MRRDVQEKQRQHMLVELQRRKEEEQARKMLDRDKKRDKIKESEEERAWLKQEREE